jgi:hypothetical protein
VRDEKGRGKKGPVILPDLKSDARDEAGKAVGVSACQRLDCMRPKPWSAARPWELFDQRAKDRQKRKPKSVPVILPEQKKGDSRDQAGAAVGVSGSLIDRARTGREKGKSRDKLALCQNGSHHVACVAFKQPSGYQNTLKNAGS